MKMCTNLSKARQRSWAFGVCFLLPFLMGGCPEFRNDVTSVFEGAVRTTLLGSEDEWTIASIVRGSITDATIDLVFDQFRGDQE